MENIKDYISAKRPSLSKSSLTTYSSILKNLYIRVFGDDKIDLTKFDNTEPVLKFLKDVPPNKRKTILSSLVIITDKKPYRDLMAEDVRDYNKDISKQVKTPSQEASWVETDEIKQVYDDLKQNADLIMKKKNITPSDLQQIQNYIILCVLGSVFIKPRRSKDFVDFKIKNVDTAVDNYMDKNKFFFNSYKTAKTYGKQDVDIPVQLKNIIKKWSSINPTDYLLFDANMNKLSSVKLNQRLNRIFDGKKVGVNQLRHTYLTDKFGDTINKKQEVANTMEDMGSSSSMLDTYVKK
jgi:uncharacterized protein YfkK (UPF0435 family)